MTNLLFGVIIGILISILVVISSKKYSLINSKVINKVNKLISPKAKIIEVQGDIEKELDDLIKEPNE